MALKLHQMIVINCILINVIFAMPARDSNFIEQEESCKAVCGLCECDGYYCGDECICECNLTNEEKLECIVDMKKECNKNGLEYELILQGSHPRTQREIDEYTKSMDRFQYLKQKRESNDTGSIVGEPIVQPVETENDQKLEQSHPQTIRFLLNTDPLSLDNIRNRFLELFPNAPLGTSVGSFTFAPAVTPAPLQTLPTVKTVFPTLGPIRLPEISTLRSLPTMRSVSVPTMGTVPPFKLNSNTVTNFSLGSALNDTRSFFDNLI